jgi:hypothetical protein
MKKKRLKKLCFYLINRCLDPTKCISFLLYPNTLKQARKCSMPVFFSITKIHKGSVLFFFDIILSEIDCFNRLTSS